MIPLEYENLKTWIRIQNLILVKEDKDTPPSELIHKSYINGARFVVKLLSKQWAHDIIARRRKDERP